MPKLIYIVDDEPGILQVLGALLRTLDPDWQVVEFDTPARALAAVQTTRPDLVLADQRMPFMTGSEMLEIIRVMAPQTVRIIISAQAGVAEKISSAHQFLCKPFEAQELEKRIRQALAARESLRNSDLARLMMSLRSFPALPAVYTELVNELDKADSSLDRAAELIGQDGGIFTRVIQMANSPLFGGRGITVASEALLQLGTGTVKALVLSLHVFKGYRPLDFPEMPVESLWNRSLKTARLAQDLCRKKMGQSAANDAFLAGLAYNLGCLILMENATERFRLVCQSAIRDRKPLLEVEQEVFRASHLELSGFMLRLWGMPDAVVDAVAHCQAPWKSPEGARFGPTVALYMADFLGRQQGVPDDFVTSELDLAYLNSVGSPSIDELSDECYNGKM